MNSKPIKLGDEVTAKVSGYTGIVRVISEYDNGCRRIGVHTPGLDKDGKPYDWVWFDEEDLMTAPVSKTGGPPRAGDISR